MSVKTSGGSPVTHPQRYQTLPVSVISQAEQQDRNLKRTELDELTKFFSSGSQLLEIAEILTANADDIIAAGANRIFYGGDPMAYLEKPQDPIGLPGSGFYVGEDYLTAARRYGLTLVKGDRLKLNQPQSFNPLRDVWESVKSLFSEREPVPGGFRFINISRYGPVRMKRSLRDLSWFLRYITYAIVAGDASIITVNTRGLRGVIPEDVTEATVVALKQMCRQAVTYFPENIEAQDLVKSYFDTLITEYLVEKPSVKLRPGASNDQQGLQLPVSYYLAAERRPLFVMKRNLSETQKQEVITAAYRHIFERDVTNTYGLPVTELESQLKGGQISMKEFVRRLGKSRLYRRLFYEPYVISRIIELATRHFLGRGLSSQEEFQKYFAVITKGGLPALIDALVDSQEYADYFGEETVPYLRGLGQEAQECRNWGPQIDLLKYSGSVRKVPQFITVFGKYQKPLPDQHPYGASHDPLEIQFGAIFPEETGKSHNKPAYFNKDTKRILISCSAGNSDTLNNGATFGKVPGSLGSKVLKLESFSHSNAKLNNNLSVAYHSPEAVINAAYRQVFGRELYEGQRLETAEIKLKSGEISMRQFIRQLAKSKIFRNLYWDKLYITKAIEYIHRRLLGRPTYGREEMNRYYDICATKGFYALIDEMLDSREYLEVFAEDTVPYERYVTSRGYVMRSHYQQSLFPKPSHPETNNSPDKFIAQKDNGKVVNQIETLPLTNPSPVTFINEENYELSQTSDS